MVQTTPNSVLPKSLTLQHTSSMYLHGASLSSVMGAGPRLWDQYLFKGKGNPSPPFCFGVTGEVHKLYQIKNESQE